MNGKILGAGYHLLKVLNVEERVQNYLAEDVLIPGRQLVVQELAPDSDTFSNLNLLRELFLNAGQKLQQLSQEHEQIENLVSYFEENEKFYLVQEHIIGHTLVDEMLSGTPLTAEQVIRILSEILEILVFVHERGVIHQNIKPTNIIRRESDQKLVLVNFGAIPELITNNVANLDYAPVEQLRGHSQYNSDIYALGIIAIAAVLGLQEKEILKLQQHRSVLTGEIIWRSENLNIRREIGKVFDQMVRFDHHKRYQSATEVLKEIKQVKTQRFTQQKQQKLWLTLAVISWIVTVTAVVLKSAIITINPLINFEEVYQEGLRKYQQGDYQAAVEEFTVAIKLNSQSYQVYKKRGNAFYQLGNYQGAKIDATKAIALNPQDADAYYDRGFSLYELGKYQEAVADYSQAITLNSRHAYAYYGRGLALVKMNENRRANEDFSTAIRLRPNYIEAYLQRGILRRRLRIYKTAMEDFDAIIKINPDDPRPYYQKGLIHASNNQKYAAIQEYTQAINRSPEYAVAYLQRADMHSELGYKLKAIADYDQALELNPQWGAAYNHRGIHRLSFGNYEGAIADHTKAIALNSQDVAAYNNRGNVNLELGNYKAAHEDYSQAIAINPRYGLAYYNRAVNHIKQGNKQSAIADFQQAIKIFQESGDRNNLRDAQQQLNLLQQ
jgi:tetratricopeptide (TPR) repeat protein